VPYKRERLDRVELKPFRAAIAAGVDSIMSTHIMFPAIDKDFPATLSHKVITGLLREEFGYKGVVITDSMEMKAIADNFGCGEAAVLAVEAGVDIVLACHTLPPQREMREALIRAVKDGRISEERIDQSVARIMALKDKYNLAMRRSVDPSMVSQQLSNPVHKALQMEVARKAVTLVRNQENMVPLDICEKCRVAVVGLHHTVEPMAEALSQIHSNVEVIKVDGNIEDAVNRAKNAAAIIAVTCPKEPWTAPIDEDMQTRLIKKLIASGVPTAVVAVRDPYELRKFPEADTYIACYGYRPPVLEAVVELLLGKTEPCGRLPVSIPGT
jgi:beta-N-acetylhexosaminidase